MDYKQGLASDRSNLTNSERRALDAALAALDRRYKAASYVRSWALWEGAGLTLYVNVQDDASGAYVRGMQRLGKRFEVIETGASAPIRSERGMTRRRVLA